MKKLEEICSLLQLISSEKVVWDIEDLSKKSPWGANISEEITDLSNYFVTSSGEDLIILLKHALDISKIITQRERLLPILGNLVEVIDFIFLIHLL